MPGPSVLSVLPDVPFPSATGLQIRLACNLRVVRELAGRSMVLCFHGPLSERDLDALDRSADDVVLVGPPVSYASFSIADRVGHRLRFLLEAARRRRGRRYPLSLVYDEAGAEATIRATAARTLPDFVVLPIWFAHYAPALEADGFRVIVDAYDVLTDQTLNMAKTYGRRHPARLPGLLANYVATRAQERLCLPACTEIWANSAAQAARFRDLVTGPRIVVVGNVLDEAAIEVTPPPRNGAVGFIGAYGYPPNLAAARHLALEVFPRLRAQMPEARLLLAGGGMAPSAQEELSGIPGVELLGRVPDSGAFMSACEALAFPIFFESGPPLKVVEALARARPIVASPEIAAALELAPGRDVLVARDPQAAADGLRRVLTDHALGDALAARGRRVFERRFSLGFTIEEARRTSVLAQGAMRDDASQPA